MLKAAEAAAWDGWWGMFVGVCGSRRRIRVEYMFSEMVGMNVISGM